MSNNEALETFFTIMPYERMLVEKRHYETIIAREKNLIGGKIGVPWMIPHWEHGLSVLNRVIEKKLAQSVQTKLF
jgi:hypothetical protein